jgi:hypothetical protein
MGTETDNEHEILFVNRQLQTWQRSETLSLYPINVTYGLSLSVSWGGGKAQGKCFRGEQYIPPNSAELFTELRFLFSARRAGARITVQ